MFLGAAIVYGSIDEEGASTSASSKNRKSQFDVSVPYNAAAKFAYEQEGYNATNSEEIVDFDTFAMIYQQRAVAIATLKKRRRDVERAIERAQKEAAEATAELVSLREAQNEVAMADLKYQSLQKRKKENQ